MGRSDPQDHENKTYIHKKEIIKYNLPSNFLFQHNLEENVDQRKANLGWFCHLHYQPLS